MSIYVRQAGVLATIQDLGRVGFQKHGMVVGGAVDSLSHRLANILVGNKENEAAIEVTLAGTSLQFKESALISITGGHLSATTDGVPVPMWRPVWMEKGAALSFGHCVSGCRAYVAVSGGLAVPEVMNSKSTYIRGGIGGLNGRALKKGDILPIGQVADEMIRFQKVFQGQKGKAAFWAASWFVPVPSHIIGGTISVIKGREFERFTMSAQTQFFRQEFSITPQSDRMGCRLLGPLLSCEKPVELLSEAVANGTIQVPPDGNPIVLLADRQTTGGYMRIGQAASVDLPKLGQIKPGDRIRFREITLARAEQQYIQREYEIRQLKAAIGLRIKNMIKSGGAR